MVEDSWTYARFTDDEKQKWNDVLEHIMLDRALKYTDNHKWDVLNAVYYSFLIALDYKPIGWREDK